MCVYKHYIKECMFLVSKDVVDLAVSEADLNKKVTLKYSVPPYSDYFKFKLECKRYDKSDDAVYFEYVFEDAIFGKSLLYVLYLFAVYLLDCCTCTFIFKPAPVLAKALISSLKTKSASNS